MTIETAVQEALDDRRDKILEGLEEQARALEYARAGYIAATEREAREQAEKKFGKQAGPIMSDYVQDLAREACDNVIREISDIQAEVAAEDG